MNLHDPLIDWKAYTETPEYQKQRSRHAPRHQHRQAACVPPAAKDTNSTSQQQTACAPPVEPLSRGRGSTHYYQLAELRKLRKTASKGKANPSIMQWFQSGFWGEKLVEMTIEHGAGQFYDIDGNAIVV